MTDYQWLAVAIFFGLSPLAGAIIYLAHRMQGVVTVTVTQPPITVTQPPITVHQPDITVQAPTAILPEKVERILEELNAKIQTPEVPLTPISDEQLTRFVEDAVAMAEGLKGVRGADKFRNARSFVLDQAQGLKLSVDERALALRIESVVKASRKALK